MKESRKEIPIKPCTAEDLSKFAPARLDNKQKIESLYEIEEGSEKGLFCLDIAKFGRIEVYGSFESDISQSIELRLQPCSEQNPNCRVSEFRDKTSNKMDITALWDAIGWPEI